MPLPGSHQQCGLNLCALAMHFPGDIEVSEQRLLPETFMTLGTILLIVLILLLVGALPSWPHSRSWGYGPSGLLGVVLVVLVILLLMGRI